MRFNLVKTTISLFLTTLLITAGLPCTALAQYFQDLIPGYSESVASEEDTVLINTPHPMVLQAQDASGKGLVLNCLIQLQKNMRSKLSQVYTGDTDPYFAESHMEYQVNLPRNRDITSVDYEDRVYVGVGIEYEGDSDWGYSVITTYMSDADGYLREQGRYPLGDEYIAYVFIMDANHDGLLDVIASWMTGAGAGGGVDMMSVLPDASLALFGDPEEEDYEYNSGFWSAHGMVEPIDYDNDGVWELQVTFPLFYSAAGYYARSILKYSETHNRWLIDDDFAPEYYVEEETFYLSLYEAVQEFVMQPSDYANASEDAWGDYAVELEGELRIIDLFLENGKPAQGLIDDLRDFVFPEVYEEDQAEQQGSQFG